ncbi:MAG: hypothetical protein PHG21_01520 [Azoarcus sp.]|nr:hypothetical protein [Azoarcus sp.]
MDTTMRLPAADTAALQSARQSSRPVAQDVVRDSGMEGSESSVQVSISDEGRAAEEAASLSATSAQVPASGAEVVTRPAEARASRDPESTVATAGPASDPVRVQSQAPDASAGSRGVSTATAQAERNPDASSAANKPAVQLYLDNSSRPSSQAAPSTVRVSA